MADKWDRRFLGLAAEVAGWSKDPSTQVGAVIVRPDRRFLAEAARVLHSRELAANRAAEILTGDMRDRAPIDAFAFYGPDHPAAADRVAREDLKLFGLRENPNMIGFAHLQPARRKKRAGA
jgi:hypothetical protein